MTHNAADDPARLDWVGQDALRWVIDDAPVPVDLAWTLTVIARKCDKNGKGSFQSKQTLSEKTGKSEAQVSRDIKELLKLGLLRLGDQTLPGRHGYPRGQWPTVYDLAMEKKGPKPARQSKNPTGRKKATGSDIGQTPGMDAGGGMDARGGMHAPDTPRMDASPTPCMDAPQRRPSRNPLITPPPLPPVVADGAPNAGTREEGVEFLNQNANPHRHQAARLADPYTSRMRSGQLADLEAQLADALGRGWTAEALERELAARHDGLNDLGAGLIARIRNLKQPPAPRPRESEPLPGEGERCPLHRRNAARSCGLCWGDVKAGQDPYAKHEELRPGWWHDVYRRPTRRPRQETMNE